MATVQALGFSGIVSLAIHPKPSTLKNVSIPQIACGRQQWTSVQKSPSSARKTPRIGFLSSSIIDARLAKAHIDMWNVRKGCGVSGALGTVCYLSADTLRWVFTAAAATLLFLKNVGIEKKLLVPLLALELPREVFGWMRGEYGYWTAFILQLAALFYYLPGELQLPFALLLLVIIAPGQLLQYRGTTPAAVVTLALVGYVGYQHVQNVGGAREAFHQKNIVPTVAALVLLLIPLIAFIQGYY